MEQYAIHIHGNDSVNLNFKELNYKLLENEVMVGKANSFPEKVNIKPVIGFNSNIFDGVKTEQKTATITPSTAYRFAISNWILTTFGEGIASYNSGVSFMVDFYFAFNHFLSDHGVVTHYAGSQHKRATFTMYKTKVAGAYMVCSPLNWQYHSGVWIEYDSSTKTYDSILASGTLGLDAFPVVLENSFVPGKTDLKITNNLSIETGISSVPNYEVDLVMKLRAFEFSQDDHTIEVI